MNATHEAFCLFQELETGTQMVALNGFDSDLVAVVSNAGVSLLQSYDGENTQSVFLPDDCFKQLIKILQEKIDVFDNEVSVRQSFVPTTHRK